MRRTGLLLAILAALVAPQAAGAAAPNYIVITGAGIGRAIVLDDWNENLDLLLAVSAAPRANVRLRGRPRLDLAEFWGWSGRARPVGPAGANQHGAFYPAHASRPAVILLAVAGRYEPRLVSSRVRSILARHGVPLSR